MMFYIGHWTMPPCMMQLTLSIKKTWSNYGEDRLKRVTSNRPPFWSQRVLRHSSARGRILLNVVRTKTPPSLKYLQTILLTSTHQHFKVYGQLDSVTKQEIEPILDEIKSWCWSAYKILLGRFVMSAIWHLLSAMAALCTGHLFTTSTDSDVVMDCQLN